MKRLLSHQAIFDMNQALRTCKFGGRLTTSFRYALRRNIDSTGKEVDTMVEAFKPDDEYIEYHKKLADIAAEYGINNIDNVAETDKIIKALDEEKRAEFIKRQAELGDSYQDALERQHLVDDELNKFLKEKIEIDLVMVPINEVPEEIENENAFVLFNQIYPMILPAPESEEVLKDIPYEYK